MRTGDQARSLGEITVGRGTGRGRGDLVTIGLWGTWYSRLVEVLILNGGTSKTRSGLNCLTRSVVVP